MQTALCVCIFVVCAVCTLCAFCAFCTFNMLSVLFSLSVSSVHSVISLLTGPMQHHRCSHAAAGGRPAGDDQVLDADAARRGAAVA